MSAVQSVLLTGSSGNLGAVILEQLMQTGIKVTAPIRSIAKVQADWNQQYGEQLKTGQLQLVEISDLTVPGAFHQYARGVDVIIHPAAPIAYEDVVEKMINLGWPILENVLTAAKDSGSVKRVIVTGSIVSTMELPQQIFGSEVSAETWNTSTFEESTGDYNAAYAYMKTSSEQKGWEWIQKEKPSFDLIQLLAPSITGKSIQPGFQVGKEKLGGTPALFHKIIDKKEPEFVFPWFMDVEDVARHHVKSLDLANVPGNERYLFRSRELMSGPRLAKQLRAKYPQFAERIPEGGDFDNWPKALSNVDVSKAEKVFGHEWKSAWESAEQGFDDIFKAEA